MSLAIAITYFNEGKLLTECLESIRAQSGAPDEILVYDDASSIPAREFIPADMAVRLTRSEVNRGPGYGRNALLGLAGSEYIHFQDADDLFKPDWLCKISGALKKTPDIVLTEVSYQRPNGEISENVLNLQSLNEIKDIITFGLRGCILPSAATVLRSKALAIGGYKTREVMSRSEDFDFHIRFLAGGVRYEVIPESLILARERADSYSNKAYPQCFISVVDSLEEISSKLPKTYLPELSDTAVKCGSILYQLGKKREAAEAFIVAKHFGIPSYGGRSSSYKLAARLLGPMAAEALGAYWRRLAQPAVQSAGRTDIAERANR